MVRGCSSWLTTGSSGRLPGHQQERLPKGRFQHRFHPRDARDKVPVENPDLRTALLLAPAYPAIPPPGPDTDGIEIADFFNLQARRSRQPAGGVFRVAPVMT